MRAKAAKWGNSVAVRLPKAVVDELHLGVGTELDVRVEGGELHLKPMRRTSRDLLEELVEQARRLGPDACTPSVKWGPDRGSEIIDDEYSRGEITLSDLIGPEGADESR